MRRLIDAAATRRDDEGMSLIEVMMSMAIMSVLMVVFTGAILQIYKSNTATDTVSAAQSQVHQAFQRFDKELRYASWIATPGQVGTNKWAVEFAGADSTKCEQLVLDTTALPATGNNGRGVLKLVRWTLGTPPTSTTPRQTLASNIVDQGNPFLPENPAGMASASPSPSPSPSASAGTFVTSFQRLGINLKIQVANASTTVNTTFTALNTSPNTSTTNGCSEGRATA
ncbi:type II secretion system protein J [Krasilnikovia sp. M28-CT-15]|uniref:PulJ/GspJ family protein n=1 Tax=Krasilnikovia sp. M28-CT-15 TaxID=3373540 RepID=UPI003875CC4F